MRRVCSFFVFVITTMMLIVSLPGEVYSQKKKKEKIKVSPTSPAPGLILATQLTEELTRIAESTGGRLGVYVQHIQKNLYSEINSGERFPMASIYKLPIAVYYLHLAHERKINLNDTVWVTESNIAPDFSPMMRRWLSKGDFRVTNLEVLRAMLQESDNTACDIILSQIKNLNDLNRYFASQGLTGFSVDRTERAMALDLIDAGNPRLKNIAVPDIDSVIEHMSSAQKTAALESVMKDKRDTATPKGIGDLLVAIHNRTLKNFSDYDLLLKLMTETQVGLRRIKAGLPNDASLAHRTGTHRTLLGVNMVTNNVGIITLPKTGEHIVLAVFLKESKSNTQEREATIASVTKAVMRHFQTESK